MAKPKAKTLSRPMNFGGVGAGGTTSIPLGEHPAAASHKDAAAAMRAELADLRRNQQIIETQHRKGIAAHKAEMAAAQRRFDKAIARITARRAVLTGRLGK